MRGWRAEGCEDTGALATPKQAPPSPRGQSCAQVPKPCPGARAAPIPMALNLGVAVPEPLCRSHLWPSLAPPNQLGLAFFYCTSLGDFCRPQRAPAPRAKRGWGVLFWRRGRSGVSAPGADETPRLERHGQRGTAGGARATTAAAATPTDAVLRVSRAETRKQELGLRIENRS